MNKIILTFIRKNNCILTPCRWGNFKFYNSSGVNRERNFLNIKLDSLLSVCPTILDINECDADICGTNSVFCTNTAGDYICGCDIGFHFREDPYGLSCEGNIYENFQTVLVRLS